MWNNVTVATCCCLLRNRNIHQSITRCFWLVDSNEPFSRLIIKVWKEGVSHSHLYCVCVPVNTVGGASIKKKQPLRERVRVCVFYCCHCQTGIMCVCVSVLWFQMGACVYLCVCLVVFKQPVFNLWIKSSFFRSVSLKLCFLHVDVLQLQVLCSFSFLKLQFQQMKFNLSIFLRYLLQNW